MTPYSRALNEYLNQFLTPQRRQRFEEVLSQRTRKITVVVADIFQQHNASAILRTCEAFGIQDVHISESKNEFESHPEIALGADKWLTLKRYQGKASLQNCMTALKKSGYRIVATALHTKSRPIQELSLKEPVALMFGTEKTGLPKDAMTYADEIVHLPMYGFMESFNVSVSVALSLQTLLNRLRQQDTKWPLTEQEKNLLRVEWARLTVPGAAAIEKQFQQQFSS